MNIDSALLASILTRLDALEADVSGEVLQPNYLTIDPATGKIGAAFSGLISALGVILAENVGGTPPVVANSIEWRDANNVTQEFLTGDLQSGSHRMLMEAGGGSTGNMAGGLSIEVTPLGAQIFASAQGRSVEILDDQGRSQFVQPSDAASTSQHMGMPAGCFGNAGTGTSYGPGTGLPHGIGFQSLYDPSGRWSGGANPIYITPSAGLFLVISTVIFAASVATACTLSANNASTGWETSLERVVPASLIEGMTHVALVPATGAGQSIQSRFSVNQNVSIRGTDTQLGTDATVLWIMQMM